MTATSPEPIERMGRDLRLSSRTLGEREARYLTDLYYQVQDYRKRGANQAHFYTLVTRETKEQEFALRRQLFLCEQGYAYSIVDGDAT